MADPACPAAGEDMVEHQRTLGMVLFYFASVYIPASLIWWFFRRHTFAIQKRNGRLMLVTAIGVYFQILTTGWVNWQGYNSLPCDVHAFTVFMIVPMVAGPIVVRIILFYNKAKYNKLIVMENIKSEGSKESNGSGFMIMGGRFRRKSLMSEMNALVQYALLGRFVNSGDRRVNASTATESTVAETRYYDSGVSDDGSFTVRKEEDYMQRTLKRKRKAQGKSAPEDRNSAIAALYLAQKFWFSLAILMGFLLLGLLSILMQYLETDSPYGKGCYGCALDLVDSFLMAAVLLVVVLFSGVFLWKLRREKIEDPLHIARELRNALLCGFFAALFTVVSAVDPGGLRNESKEFDWMYVVSFVSLILFTVLCPLPVLNTYMLCISKDDEDRLRLSDVLENPDAKVALGRYLASEFSLENLCFHDAVAQYKATHSKGMVTRVREIAQEIKETFIDDNSMLQVNISHACRREVISKLASSTSASARPPAEVFDEALASVHLLMESDSFPRFKKSPYFQEVKRSVLSTMLLHETA